MSKVFKYLLILVAVIGTTLVFSLVTSEHDQEYCPFCDQSILDYQKFYEDDLVVAMCTHRPVFPGHCLIIPKRHIERFEFLSDEETVQIANVIKKVNRAVETVFGTSSYLILQKNGKEVGQQVPHIHFHYIPRKTGDDSTLKFYYRMYLSTLGSPLDASEMYDIVEKLKAVMEE
jgi:diadenosine tetraphosphate (Ap4A) HIT family hydrolase